MWELEQGLRIVRALQRSCRQYEYHVAIGGGVVNKGSSEKDLDLYFLPMGSFEGKQPDAIGMLSFLEALWGYSEDIAREYPGSKPASRTYTKAVKFSFHGKRIDCFIF